MRKGTYQYAYRAAVLTALSAGLVLSGCAGRGKSTETQAQTTAAQAETEAQTEAETETEAQTEAGEAAEETLKEAAAKGEKPRTVITTDGEVDDMNSVIRALLYSNDMDISGIVLTSSVYHYAGDEEKGIEPYRWTGTQWVYDFIDDYAAVYDNLKAHDPDYPEPEYLRSVTKIGNISNKGEMEEETEGSKFLEELFLDDDDRKLYVQTWGGTNTTARALKSIEETYKDTDEWEAVQKKIYDKLVLYIILDQDDSYGEYIAKSWPDLEIINDRSNFWHFAYAWQYHSDELNDTLKGGWCYENLVKDKGPLMENYALIGDGKEIEGELYEEMRGTQDYLDSHTNYSKYDFISEGDSPSFLYLIDTGLRSLEDPSYGGWGGRFGEENGIYVSNALDYDPYTGQYEAQYSLSRWFTDMQNDFAGRVEWCLTDDDTQVNHVPVLTIEEGIDIEAKAGETVTLTAKGEDPDGDNLTYHWWRYHEADTYQDSLVDQETEEERTKGGSLVNLKRSLQDGEVVDRIEIQNADESVMSFQVPEDAKPGDTIHMIAEVQDDGAHTLKRYQRVIITIQ